MVGESWEIKGETNARQSPEAARLRFSDRGLPSPAQPKRARQQGQVHGLGSLVVPGAISPVHPTVRDFAIWLRVPQKQKPPKHHNTQGPRLDSGYTGVEMVTAQK